MMSTTIGNPIEERKSSIVRHQGLEVVTSCCMMAMGGLKSEESEEDYRDDDETENALALWAIQGGSSSQKPVTIEAIRAAARIEQNVTKPLSLSQLRETCNEISKSRWPVARQSPPLTLAALKESCKKATEEAAQDVNLLTRSGQMYKGNPKSWDRSAEQTVPQKGSPYANTAELPDPEKEDPYFDSTQANSGSYLPMVATDFVLPA